jgi:hypothetical protein
MDCKNENLSLVALDSNPRILQSNSITFSHVRGILLLTPHGRRILTFHPQNKRLFHTLHGPLIDCLSVRELPGWSKNIKLSIEEFLRKERVDLPRNSRWVRCLG